MSLLNNLWEAERRIVKLQDRIAELEAERDRLQKELHSAVLLVTDVLMYWQPQHLDHISSSNVGTELDLWLKRQEDEGE